MMTMGSGVWAGTIPIETAWSCQEVSPNSESTRKSFKDELDRIGYLGSVPASWEAQPIAAHFELHIEQGPILENEERRIGVVGGGQGFRWFEVEVNGRGNHAGTTPLSARYDALLASAKMIVASNEIAKTTGAVVTTGIINAEPGSVNTVPHSVRFTLDVRHQSERVLSDTIDRFGRAFDEVAKEHCEKSGDLRWKQISHSNPMKFDQDCITVIEQSAEEVCTRLGPSGSGERKLWKLMMSGASHDSVQVSTRCPTAMIFTPTRQGMSHTPTEYCKPEDCALGAQTLIGAVLRYDAFRTKRGDFN
jgi:hydantoinase/carbamoylase family amidase